MPKFLVEHVVYMAQRCRVVVEAETKDMAEEAGKDFLEEECPDYKDMGLIGHLEELNVFEVASEMPLGEVNNVRWERWD